MAKQNKNNSREVMDVRVDMETLLKGAKVLLKEKQKEVTLRSIVGIEKAMPEVKAIGRNMVMHAGVTLTKVAAESIIGNSEGLDKVAEIAHTGIAVNTAYNTVIGVSHFRKGYENATKEQIQNVLKRFEDAANRYEEEDEEPAF